jgi:hypothetical protein
MGDVPFIALLASAAMLGIGLIVSHFERRRREAE